MNPEKVKYLLSQDNPRKTLQSFLSDVVLKYGPLPVAFKNNLLDDVAQFAPDLVDIFPEISIAARCDDRPEGEDCFTFLFGMDSDVPEVMDSIYRYSEHHSDPLPGRVAVYYDFSLNPTHIGLVTQEDNLVSKWGVLGHVVTHPYILYPASYGFEKRFYNIPPEYSLNPEIVIGNNRGNDMCNTLDL